MISVLRSVSLVALAAAALSASAQTIDTYPSGGAAFGINPFGNDNTATYGQTFLAANSLLTSYTSSFQYQSGSAYTFQFYIAAWDDGTSRYTGPILYTSGILSSTAGTQDYTLNPNLALTTGQRYVAFFSTSLQSSRPSGTMFMGYNPTDTYSDGMFVYQNNGTDFGALSSGGWNTFGGLDSAFRAEFASSVPGPAAALPFALMALRRRRKA